ncbi:MAG TPA: glycosyltransferase [Terriglobia bacterium]|nr:glycosyltransferase [Terriglobia bacterium]
MSDADIVSPGPLGSLPISPDGDEALASEVSSDLPAGVVFQALVYGGTGYAEAGWVEVLGLARSGIPVQLVPLGDKEDYRRLLPASARNALDALKLAKVDPARSVFYQGAMAYLWDLNTYGRCRVGHTMFETDRLPDGWARWCNAMDEVWVPSEFNRETFAAAGVDPHRLRVLPLGVDASLFRPGSKPFQWQQARGFKFLSMFDLQDRKGMDLLLKAYLAEFKANEDVCLILKITQHTDRMADPTALLTYFVEKEAGLSLEKTPPIILVQGFVPRAELPRLYASADAFVLPSRGEGFGLPYIEALACGLPVIATRWSSHLDFLHDGNSYLIDIEGLVPASWQDVEYFAGHRWAQPRVEHLRQLMRTVYSNREEARRRAEIGRQEILERWDWSVVVKRWVAEFRRLLDG